MTLPINYKFPELNEAKSPEQVTSYLQDLNYELQNMYEKTAQNVNGVFRSDLDVDGSQYKPTLRGGTVQGTFTYTRQAAYVLRQGIMVDVWFDVSWTSSGTASGQLYLDLPYKVTQHPFLFMTGSCFINGASFGSGRTAAVCCAVTNTYLLSFQLYGSGTTTDPLAVYGSGRVGGHTRYIGVEDE